jgi:methylmalonyl-CoA/ethylmalonyl-CoA epimerase
MLSLEEWPAGGWRPPVLRTVATTGAGVAELVTTIDRFREQTAGTLGSRRRARGEWRLREILGRRFMQHVEAHVLEPGEFERFLDRIAARESDPYGAAAAVMARAGMTGAATPRPMSLDHVGIAVPDGAPYAALLAALFGLVAGEPETLGPHRLRFIDTGDAVLELVEPLADDAPVAKFLAKRGTALHHICLRVPDVERAIAALAARGVRMIDTVPRPGAHGSRIAFIHPSSTGGILIELKEPSRSH